MDRTGIRTWASLKPPKLVVSLLSINLQIKPKRKAQIQEIKWTKFCNKYDIPIGRKLTRPVRKINPHMGSSVQPHNPQSTHNRSYHMY